MFGPKKVLLTGATGYVGSRLLPELVARGYKVRCLVRNPKALAGKASDAIEIVRGDLLELVSLARAMDGTHTAYYLVHSMESKGAFDEEETRSAHNFARAAKAAGVRRIIYLGGLGRDEKLSAHLQSRQSVGRILRESGVPAIEFRASIIIGAGSISFEMIRALMDRLPVMTTPKWVRVLAQPIGIDDVIQYLLQAMEIPLKESRVFEIGGPERMSYLDLMKEYGKLSGLKRLIIPVPVLSPGLSSLWLKIVTPLYAHVGRKLIESIRYKTVVEDEAALKVFSVKPTPIRAAMEKALRDKPSARAIRRRVTDSRSLHVEASPAEVFRALLGLGGKNGWYHADLLWKVRGFLDERLGGVGMRRPRRHPALLAVGDTLDCWRVEALEQDAFMRLAAEMKLPGKAWLEFRVEKEGSGSVLTQTAVFEPEGTAGRLYWYSLFPFHHYVFSGMIRKIAHRAGDKRSCNGPAIVGE